MTPARVASSIRLIASGGRGIFFWHAIRIVSPELESTALPEAPRVSVSVLGYEKEKPQYVLLCDKSVGSGGVGERASGVGVGENDGLACRPICTPTTRAATIANTITRSSVLRAILS